MAEDAGKVEVSFSVNGHRHTLHVHPMARLLDVLREELHLTGTKEGCGEGDLPEPRRAVARGSAAPARSGSTANW
jgi:xanthine dehydrogenase iron-sulfur cluster and FAD-binding subunit A